MNLSPKICVTLATLVTLGLAVAPASAAPTPVTLAVSPTFTAGANDIYELPGVGNPVGNYQTFDYTNRGPGQIFTTLGNGSGYALNSVTFEGNGDSGNPTTATNFTLQISSVAADGTTLTSIGQFTAPASAAFAASNNYLTFNLLGQNVNLNPNRLYALGITTSSSYFGLQQANTGNNTGSATLQNPTTITTTLAYQRAFDAGLTPNAPVPELSSNVSLGFLLILGIVGFVAVRKRSPQFSG